MGKTFKKVRKVVAKVDLAHQLVKKAGLPDPSGDLFYGSDKALSPQEQAAKLAKEGQDQQAELARQQQIIADNATALAANSAVENTATVVAGGSADANDALSDMKRKRVSSLSSTLGVS
ncbi:hypothetical protein D9M71_679770 [compost metagenome]